MATMTITNVDGTTTKIVLGDRYDDFMYFVFPDFITGISLYLCTKNMLAYKIHRTATGEYVNATCTFTMETTDDLDYIITE